MKAALFERIGKSPAVVVVPDPVAGDGDVVVDVVAAPVLAYAHEVLSGERPMLFELPFVPGTGAIGRVSVVGPDATELKVGDWVYCDPTIRARDSQGLPAIALQGLTANGPTALPLQRQYRNGSWAERLRLPLENVVPIGDIDADDAGRWLTLGTMLVPYGGLSSVGLTAGETVVVNGSTGAFGSAAVAVALAMGAAGVVATGRNEAVLDALVAKGSGRVRPARMTGDQDADTAAIRTAARGPIDVVFDILPPQASEAQVLAAIRSVRPGGRISLMGGVGMGGGGELVFPYPWLMRNNITIKGQWMYPRDAVGRLVALARSGVLDLHRYEVSEFPLDALAEAIDNAAATAGPFARTVLRI
ncbi:zinc-binding dehydrogenase [Polymorphobacter sp. PAMC 29334]|uniref:MDR/zinc-dependent alcohol dehydrogenase-like family protein n=1 Tax=Polymorphobacter sp. PAMC 29334 TaxID=2862331 RepID=UPI001C75D89C|nr:medium chain dehydrogenase/reductase family protein [Polymorphobacter sp. PAMC 29334]QYE36310.1 zinc-binding dehydrogenase [Polymorphobacter sp. PAMC 29334]